MRHGMILEHMGIFLIKAHQNKWSKITLQYHSSIKYLQINKRALNQVRYTLQIIHTTSKHALIALPLILETLVVHWLCSSFIELTYNMP